MVQFGQWIFTVCISIDIPQFGMQNANTIQNKQKKSMQQSPLLNLYMMIDSFQHKEYIFKITANEKKTFFHSSSLMNFTHELLSMINGYQIKKKNLLIIYDLIVI